MARFAKSKPKPADLPTFTVAQVEIMLRAAGAREPWAQPERCEMLACTLVRAAQAAVEPVTDGGYLAMARRARDAAAELQRTLQVMLPVFEHPPQAGDLVDLVEWRHEHAKKLRVLEAALDAFEGDPIPFRVRKPNELPYIAYPGAKGRRRPAHARWASWAFALFDEYRITVGTGTKSRNGPAARFVADALNQAGFSGYGPVTPDADNAAERRRRGPKPITPQAVEGALSRAD